MLAGGLPAIFGTTVTDCAFPFLEKNIPLFQIHTEVHFHQVANETYLSIFGHGFQAPGTTPFQRWRLAPHCAERQRYWLVSTMAVQNRILPLHPEPAWIYSGLSHMISLRSHAYDSALETWTETSLHNAAGDWENKGSACRVWVHGRTPYHSQVLFSAALKVTFCICLYGGKLMVGV